MKCTLSPVLLPLTSVSRPADTHGQTCSLRLCFCCSAVRQGPCSLHKIVGACQAISRLSAKLRSAHLNFQASCRNARQTPVWLPLIQNEIHTLMPVSLKHNTHAKSWAKGMLPDVDQTKLQQRERPFRRSVMKATPDPAAGRVGDISRFPSQALCNSVPVFRERTHLSVNLSKPR